MAERERETEQRIMDAAHAVFLRRGMSGARMQEIADEAGVNKALLHYYFRSKERLAGAVFRGAIGQVLPRVYMILQSDGTIEEKVRAVVEEEFDFVGEHPYLPGYVVSEVNYHPELVMEAFGDRGPPPLEVLRRQLKEGIERGAIRRMEVEQFVANLISLIMFPFVARPLLGVMLGLNAERFEDFIADRRSTLAEFFLAGLRP